MGREVRAVVGLRRRPLRAARELVALDLALCVRAAGATHDDRRAAPRARADLLLQGNQCPVRRTGARVSPGGCRSRPRDARRERQDDRYGEGSNSRPPHHNHPPKFAAAVETPDASATAAAVRVTCQPAEGGFGLGETLV